MSQPNHTAVREVVIRNPQGLHARPASLIVKTANGFASKVFLTIGDTVADCRSIMEVIMLASPVGTVAVLEGRGPDAEDAVEAVAHLFETGFGEAYS